MKGDWIQTFTGGQVWPLDLTIEQINIEDIVHALSNICRYTGHTRVFYSIAEHCCHVSDKLPDDWKLEGLLHDASEAYLCDIPRPLKYLPEFAAYREIERRAEYVIAQRFDLSYPWLTQIKPTDNLLISAEAHALMSPVHPEWELPVEAIEGIEIQGWQPKEAKRQFLMRYDRLKRL